MAKAAPVPELSALDRTRAAIERMVMEGELPPGCHVNESALALQLQASRSLIREICRAMVESGLLTAQPNRGFFVREMSLREAGELYDIRASLARLAGAQLAARITPPQLAELRDLIERMDAACADWDAAAFYTLNNAFHDKILKFSANQRLQSVHASLLKELQIFRRNSIVTGDIRKSNEQHKAIFDALSQHDTLEAANRMEDHVQQSKLRFLENITQERV